MIEWQRDGQDFLSNKYSRGHTWTFDGGVEVPASSSPHVVPVPMSVAANVDPEEAFVASLSSCHMLWFLAIAAKRKFVVDSYIDSAVGTLEKDADSKLAITRVTLRPQIKFSGNSEPTRGQLETMHREAHEKCFIANSVKTQVETVIRQTA
jgi:organic hydroperoxide reductase OsmC/OhrA